MELTSRFEQSVTLIFNLFCSLYTTVDHILFTFHWLPGNAAQVDAITIATAVRQIVAEVRPINGDALPIS